MDISYNETFRQVSTNLQTVIDINTARYREYQRQTTSHIGMGSRYVNYLMQNILLEVVLIFLSYLMYDNQPQVSIGLNQDPTPQLVEEDHTQVPIQDSDPDPDLPTSEATVSGATVAPLRLPRNRNTLIRDYFFSYTIDPIFNTVTKDIIGTRPTEEQITLATEHILYDPSGNQTECPITLERFQEGEQVCRIIHCGHIFKSASLQRWFRRNVRCPVCRYDIRDYCPDVPEDEDEYADLPELIDDPINMPIRNNYDASFNIASIRTFFDNANNRMQENFNNRMQQNQPIVNEIVNNIINNTAQNPEVNELVTNIMDIFTNRR